LVGVTGVIGEEGIEWFARVGVWKAGDRGEPDCDIDSIELCREAMKGTPVGKVTVRRLEDRTGVGGRAPKSSFELSPLAVL